MKRLFATGDGWEGLVLRVTLGIVMFPHGAQKVFGWFGGPGLAGALSLFTDRMHIPALLAVLVIAAESLGAVGLIIGLLSRVAALGILCDMVGAIVLVHGKNGFFMNWQGNKAGEGFEYHLLAIAISLAVLIGGGGRLSLDRWISRRMSP